MNIVIVGGGTAGWLTAYSLAKLTSHEITVIESSDVPIIGAGEGSTGALTDFLTGQWCPLDFTIEEFIENTKATTKLGIVHKNWKGDGTQYMAPLDGSPTDQCTPDKALIAQIISDRDKFHTCSYLGFSYENNLRDKLGSFHFDAFLVGNFLKKKLLEKNEVTIVDAVVDEILTDDKGYIKTLIGKNLNLSADFFIDCTGFKRLLINKVGGKWHSYQKHLPVNRALAFQKPLENNYEQVTYAHALKNGWVWKIPTQERYGCGYVFSDAYTTRDNAYKEIVEHYGNVDILREFSFDTGRQEKVWINNCLSLGLSSSFAEPLEATSIHTTLIQLVKFLFEYLEETQELTCNQKRINYYNKSMNKMYDDIKDFLVLHYMGGRTDSEFWRAITNKETTTEFVEYIIDMSQSGRMISPLTFASFYDGMVGSTLYKWILIGLGIFNPGNIDIKNIDFDFEINELNGIKEQWSF